MRSENITWHRLISQQFEAVHLVASFWFSETVMRVDELDATIQMMLYTDHTYTKVYSSAPTIELRNKVGQVSVPLFTDSELLYLYLRRASLKKQNMCRYMWR